MAPAVCAAVVALLLYAVTLRGTYVYDDVWILKLDKRLEHPALWNQYWTDSYNGGIDNLYRPLVSMTYAIQWWLHGHRAWAFHLVNWLMHAGVCAMVAELARRLLDLRTAYIAGLLFAAHPIHVEAVAGIIGRAELMCALGFLGALILMLRPLTVGRALAIVGCFVLALLSKEQGMLLPLALLILALCRRFDRRDARHNKAALQMLVLLLCWLTAGYIVWREHILKFWWDTGFLDWTQNPLVRPDADRVWMPFVLVGHYAQLLLAPVRLSIDYGGPVIGWRSSIHDPYLWLGFASVLLWLVCVFTAWRRRNRTALFTLLCLMLTYVVIGNFVTLIGTIFGERLMYLPSVFFVILIAIAVRKVPIRVLAPALALVLALGAWRTASYAARWNDRLAFYEQSLAEQPRSVALYKLTAVELDEQGRLEEAAEVAKRGRDIQPDYWEMWILTGKIAMDREQWDLAEHDLTVARDLKTIPKTVGWLAELDRRRAQATTAPTKPSH